MPTQMVTRKPSFISVLSDNMLTLLSLHNTVLPPYIICSPTVLHLVILHIPCKSTVSSLPFFSHLLSLTTWIEAPESRR